MSVLDDLTKKPIQQAGMTAGQVGEQLEDHLLEHIDQSAASTIQKIVQQAMEVITGYEIVISLRKKS